MQIPVVTIDGPSASGKGTLSVLIARHLNWHFLDSGKLYRVLALKAMRVGINLTDEKALAKLAENLPVQFIEAAASNALETKLIIENQDVSGLIGGLEIGRAASIVSAFVLVRQALLQRQRDFLQPPGLVADGRDMGTVVFPEAKLKLFVTATVEKRAERRYKQLKDQGIDVSLQQILAQLQERDARDMGRGVAPLKPAVDAMIVDTSALNVEQAFTEISQIIAERGIH